MSWNKERIAEELRAGVARVLRDDVTDPRVSLVTLIRVDLAPDLSQAFVYWSPLETKNAADVEEIERGLESASSFVRRRLASQLKLRRMPALDFRYDAAFEAGARTLELLSSVRDE